ncbi:valine--tRNA ligase [Pseudomonadota bacterium]
MKQLPKKYNPKESEPKWQKYWAEQKIYKWEKNLSRNETFIIDTPPPTVSGQLHMGHIFSYSQAEMVARYQRMKGKTVFYPIGFDDNGLPTERYVEKMIGKKGTEMPRDEFVKICREKVTVAEEEFEYLFKSMGFSFDWDEKYQTISPMSQKIAQMSFVDLYNKGVLYRKEEPVIWDVVDQTALAQTEVEDKEVDSEKHYLRFELFDGSKKLQDLEIMTTRPELLPACVAVMYHPEDENASKYRDKFARTPLGVIVPMIADEKVELGKGTGVVMCCTFGDQKDVEWWRLHNLHLRIVLDESGKITFKNIQNLGVINKKYKEELGGLFSKKARIKILELLKQDGYIVRSSEPIKHVVKVGERSKAPIEILVTKQWFVKVLDIKDKLHKKTDECDWYPEFMKIRMHNWIDGLGWDWCISRQRFSGVPIPVWYSKRKGEEGKVIVGGVDKLPVDPMIDLPEGYSADEVEPEKDIFDTWFTSSVSPQLSSHGITSELAADPERFEKLALPFDLRPQAHEIIRTWAFCTIVKAYYHQDIIPWKNLMISGWCLAADKTKMSKSKGNVITPQKLIDEKGTDAVRYWASTSNLGTDTAYSEDAIKIGNKLITKLWNSAKFGQMHFESVFGGQGEVANELPTTPKSDIETGKIYEKIDLWILLRLTRTTAEASSEFEKFEYAGARSIIENFFWNDFCDNYLEIVKIRCYGAGGNKYDGISLKDTEIAEITKAQHSGVYTIYHCLKTILKLFAPFIPHITEEIYSYIYKDEFNEKKSIHSRGQWPKVNEFVISDKVEEIGELVVRIIAKVRMYKSNNGLGMNASLNVLNISHGLGVDVSSISEDLKNVTGAKEVKFGAEEFEVEIK